MPRRWTSYLTQLTLGLLFASVAMNVLQARKIRDLVEPAVSVRSRVGQVASPVTATALDGRARTISFDGALPTVVYFFSSTCRWCERNWANVAALARASTGRFRVVGLATETDLATFAKARNLDFELFGGLSEEARRSLGLGATPHTLVVSSQGRISHEWVGAFDTRRKRAIENFFEIELPGLLPDSPKGSTER